MSLFTKIFRPEQAKESQKALDDARGFFKTLTAYRPAFTNWSGAIYESLIVRSAVDARARHFSKLKPQFKGTANPSLQNKMMQGPNQWQTWSQFLYRTSTILDITNNCFIVPVFDERMIITGYYPVLPKRCEIIEYKDEPWLRYKFGNGDIGAVELRKCAILTRHQYEKDFFGESNHALDETMKLIHIQNQGIEEAVKTSNNIRFIAQLSNFAKSEDLKKEQARFTRENLSADSESGGFLLFPSTYKDIKQIESKPYTVDADQMKMILTNVSNYFGVSEEVMQNKAKADELEAFFEGFIEPTAIQMSEAMTKAMFSERERSQGTTFTLSANRLQYMSVSQKVQMAKELGDRGALLIDDIREMFNFEPLPNGAGQVAPIRGEYKATDTLGGTNNADEE